MIQSERGSSNSENSIYEYWIRKNYWGILFKSHKLNSKLILNPKIFFYGIVKKATSKNDHQPKENVILLYGQCIPPYLKTHITFGWKIGRIMPTDIFLATVCEKRRKICFLFFGIMCKIFNLSPEKTEIFNFWMI